MKAFNNYCIKHDLVDFSFNQYNLIKSSELKNLLGINKIEPHLLFKHIEPFINAFSIEDREKERKLAIEQEFK